METLDGVEKFQISLEIIKQKGNTPWITDFLVFLSRYLVKSWTAAI